MTISEARALAEEARRAQQERVNIYEKKRPAMLQQMMDSVITQLRAALQEGAHELLFVPSIPERPPRGINATDNEERFAREVGDRLQTDGFIVSYIPLPATDRGPAHMGVKISGW